MEFYRKPIISSARRNTTERLNRGLWAVAILLVGFTIHMWAGVERGNSHVASKFNYRPYLERVRGQALLPHDQLDPGMRYGQVLLRRRRRRGLLRLRDRVEPRKVDVELARHLYDVLLGAELVPGVKLHCR